MLVKQSSCFLRLIEHDKGFDGGDERIGMSRIERHGLSEVVQRLVKAFASFGDETAGVGRLRADAAGFRMLGRSFRRRNVSSFEMALGGEQMAGGVPWIELNGFGETAERLIEKSTLKLLTRKLELYLAADLVPALLSLVALTVICLIQVVGLILVIALLALPAATVGHHVSRIAPMIVASTLLAGLLTTVPRAAVYGTRVSPESAIVLTAAGVYLLSVLLRRTARVWRSG